MPEERTSNWQRFTASVARMIVHLWPEETQAWGRAFEAELPEIETRWASLRWLIGGLMLLTRERFRHFLKSLSRPVGVPAVNSASVLLVDPVPAPRLPRFVTAIFLSISIALLCLPEVRASLASVLFPETRLQWDIQKLRQKAQATHDPQLLAFLSLLSWDNNERSQLADEAIRRDPSLTWIDYAGSYWNYADPDRKHFLSDDRIARLQNFDPENTLPLLLSAEVISHPVELTFFANWHGSALSEDLAWEHEVAKNPAWLAAMDRAFAAARIDDYWTRQLDLVNQVSHRYHLSDPDLTLAILHSHRRVDYSDIHAYTLFLVGHGDEAAQSGNAKAAAAQYQIVERFAERIQTEDASQSNSWLAATVGRSAAQKLQSLSESTGHPAETQIAAGQLAGWEKSYRKLLDDWSSRNRKKKWTRTERAGLLINLAALLIVVLFPLTVLALLGVGLAASFTRRIFGRLYRLVCLMADAVPALLALSFALLFFVYHPYARFYSTPEAINGNLEYVSNAVGVTHSLPRTVGVFLYEKILTYRSYYLWLTCTALLSTLALFLLYRMLRRRLA